MIKKAKQVQAEMTESAYKMWLAGLGAFAVAQETGTQLFSDLIKRGREVEAQSKVKAPDMTVSLRGATDRAKGAMDTLTKGMDQRVTAALHRIGVPTRDEIATLGRRVELLTASVEKLKPKARAGKPART